MAQIDISNVINVSISEAPAGIADYNVNNLAIFTAETPVTPLTTDFEVYREPSSVINRWGTGSEMALQANAIFAQSPNILSGGGALIGIPLLDLPDTAGTFTTPDISGNIDNFANVSDGAFDIAIDGAPAVSITALDFGSAPTLSSIVSVIDAALTGASASLSGNSIVFTSDTVGASSSIVLSVQGGGTDITTSNFLNISAGTTRNGFAARKELVQEAILRTRELVFYVGILATQSIDSEMPALSNYVQALDDKLLFYPSSDTAFLDSGSNFDVVRSSNNNQTRCLLYTQGVQEARIMAAAYASRGMSVNFAAANSTMTMHLKDLNTIVGDSGITQTLLELAKTMGVDTYVIIENTAKVFSTGGNDFFDDVFNLIWFVARIKVAGFNSLATTSTKLPQTEDGVEVVKGAYRAVCNSAVVNRFVGPGRWTSAETFGDPEDFRRNIEEVGYYVYTIPVSQQSQTDREARKAPVAQIAIKYQGAIHSSDVIIFINK